MDKTIEQIKSDYFRFHPCPVVREPSLAVEITDEELFEAFDEVMLSVPTGTLN